MVTLAISTSSPRASAALFAGDGALIRSSSTEAAGSVAELVAGLLADELPDRVAVDAGPGGFSATRSGVAYARVLSWALGIPAATLRSFDLVDPAATVAFPAAKGQWHVRVAQGEPGLAEEPPLEALGYGPGVGQLRYPDAALAGPLLAGAVWKDAASVMPEYRAEPSISSPRRPYRA